MFDLSSIVVVFVFVFLSSGVLASPDPACSVSGGRKVLIIGLDGTKGSVFSYAIQSGLAPNVAELVQGGGQATICDNTTDLRCASAHSGNRFGSRFPNTREETDFVWVTSPGWCSVISGVENYHHKVASNDFFAQWNYANTSLIYPSFFKKAQSFGYRTAASGTPNFLSSTDLSGNTDLGIVDWECGLGPNGINVKPNDTSSCNLDFRLGQREDDSDRDIKATNFGIEAINEHCADVVMVHYDTIDAAGHQAGFTNNTVYVAAMTNVDSLLGKLFSAVKEAVDKRDESWLIIGTSDHGGHATGHDIVIDDDEVVPFFMKTFGKESVSLSPLQQPVRHFDVHPTVLKWMGVPINNNIDGRVQGFGTSTITSVRRRRQKATSMFVRNVVWNRIHYQEIAKKVNQQTKRH